MYNMMIKQVAVRWNIKYKWVIYTNNLDTILLNKSIFFYLVIKTIILKILSFAVPEEQLGDIIWDIQC